MYGPGRSGGGGGGMTTQMTGWMTRGLMLAGRFGSDRQASPGRTTSESDPAEDPRYAELNRLCAAAPLRMLSA